MDVLCLQIAYALNVLILTPVLVSMCSDVNAPIRALQGTIENSEGLRLLVASLWSAILLLSLAGFFWPTLFLPVLMLQVIYKSLFLLTYCFPKLRAGKVENVPIGLSVSFLLIVLTYPIAIFYGFTAH
ncbi:MAG: hypothetical protein DKT66_24695 [Candidatus Melainabacteria bacterium]|nr:MAG: hypothetical protein DKT66_24695 [Candidatus Melainabacteria bacterium]